MNRIYILCIIALVCITFFSSGCAGLTPQRHAQWNYLMEQGIITGPEKFKSAGAAAVLNLIPGLAELSYLDLDDKSPGGYQIACCWLMGPFAPISWLWSIPLAIHNTEVANKELTIKAHIHEIPEELGGRSKDPFKKPKKPGKPVKPEREPVIIPPYITVKPKDFEPLPEEERPRVAVFTFEDKTPSAKTNYGAIVAEFFTTSLYHTECFRVMERTRIKEIIQEQNFSSTDMVDQTKAIEIGKLLNVEYILIGSVAKMGTVYNINARMIKVETSKIAAAAPTGKARREEDIDTTVASMANYLGSQFR